MLWYIISVWVIFVICELCEHEYLNIAFLLFLLRPMLIISIICQKAKAKHFFILFSSNKKKIPLRFGHFVDIWLFWHLNVNHFEMSYSIRNRWRNRASPFQTDQKHKEEMWTVLSSFITCQYFCHEICVSFLCSVGQSSGKGGKYVLSFKCNLTCDLSSLIKYE